MALEYWNRRPIKYTMRMRSVRLDAKGAWPERLTNFSGHGWHSFTRVGAPGPSWAVQYHSMVRPAWQNVRLQFATGSPQAMLLQPRSQYRKGQPQKKTYALAQALRNSAEAIRAKRG